MQLGTRSGKMQFDLCSKSSLIEPPQVNFTLEPGFESLFNGKDLTGWAYHASTEQEKAAREKRLKADPNAVVSPIIESDKEFRGQRASDDGRMLLSTKD